MSTQSLQACVRRATLEILGEDVTRKVPIPAGGAAASALILAAGVAPRDDGWDLFVDGIRCAPDVAIDGETDVTIKYVPRTRGA